MCYELASGQELWQRRLPSAPHKIHAANSFATSTPAVDDERVYFAWRAGETVRMAALTHDGADVWRARPRASGRGARLRLLADDRRRHRVHDQRHADGGRQRDHRP